MSSSEHLVQPTSDPLQARRKSFNKFGRQHSELQLSWGLRRVPSLLAKGLQYCVTSGNYGNGSIDATALEHLTQKFDMMRNLGFLVHNVQEAQVDAIVKALKEQTTVADLHVHAVSFMQTFTKAELPVIQGKTGMASIILHREHISLSQREELEKQGLSPIVQIVRRTGREETHRGEGTPGNKGTVITHGVLEEGLDSERQEYFIDFVSGHLDSSSALERNRDWFNFLKSYFGVYQPADIDTQYRPVSTYEDLTHKAVHNVCLSMDSNVRYILDEDGKPLDPWMSPYIGTVGMKMTAPGQLSSSYHSTYKLDKLYKEGKLKIDKASRKGFWGEKTIAGGHLDVNATFSTDPTTGQPILAQHAFVLYLPHGDASQQVVETDGDLTVATQGTEMLTATMSKGDDRDHCLITTPTGMSLKSSRGEGTFLRVQNFLAQWLNNASPELARAILTLEESPANQDKLFEIYQNYLRFTGDHSPDNGLLMKFYQQYLTTMEKLHLMDAEALGQLPREERRQFRAYFDNPALWLSIEEDPRFKAHIDEQVSPLSPEFFNYLGIKYDYQEAVLDAFEASLKLAGAQRISDNPISKDNYFKAQCHIWHLARDVMDNALIPVTELVDTINFALSLNSQIFDAINEIKLMNMDNPSELDTAVIKFVMQVESIWCNRDLTYFEKITQLHELTWLDSKYKTFLSSEIKTLFLAKEAIDAHFAMLDALIPPPPPSHLRQISLPPPPPPQDEDVLVQQTQPEVHAIARSSPLFQEGIVIPKDTPVDGDTLQFDNC